jgi:uncharacterized protein (DUF736 family)
MATIGSFTKQDDTYIGTIRTLALSVKAKIQRDQAKENEKAPDYRIFSGAVELGAAWKRTTKDGSRDYLTVKLDDPSFPAPIYANLFAAEGESHTFQLLWSR